MKEMSKRKRCDVGNINGNKLDELILEEIKKIVLQNPPLFDDVL
jgi:site-specific DNA recombinase